MRLGRFGAGRVDRRAVEALRVALADPAERGAWLDRLVRGEQGVGRGSVADPASLATLVRLRLAAVDGDLVVPLARLDTVGPLLVASDLQRHRRAPDWVMSPAPASFTLARHVRPHGHGRLLDLGAGSGIQGLLLGGPRTEVLAVDVNRRALAFTTWNARLNGRPGIRAVEGDFLGDEPDRTLDGRFETVVANPPFVISPSHEFVYRDRPLPGDAVGERTVERVSRALAPGGRGYVLCNWIDRAGRPDAWLEPVQGWLSKLDVDAVVTRVAELEPPAYAAIWTRDLEPADRPSAIETWIEALRAEGVRHVEVGVIALARRSRRHHAKPAIAAIDARERGAPWSTVEAAFTS